MQGRNCIQYIHRSCSSVTPQRAWVTLMHKPQRRVKVPVVHRLLYMVVLKSLSTVYHAYSEGQAGFCRRIQECYPGARALLTRSFCFPTRITDLPPCPTHGILPTLLPRRVDLVLCLNVCLHRDGERGNDIMQHFPAYVRNLRILDVKAETPHQRL
jgi:hypothetical protein